jgi:poly(A) polymerase
MMPSLPGAPDPVIVQLFDSVRQAAGNLEVYLVGGVVRDLLMKRASKDMDFAIAGDPRQLGRRVANDIQGDFFILDDERNTVRAIYHNPSGGRIFLDFSNLRGIDIESDLLARDFTVNAMALEIHHPDKMIDPLGGLKDLRAKILRACSENAFQDDPVRVLRGVRLALAFQLHFEPETLAAIKVAAPKLILVSPERQRDELFNILDGRQVSSAIRLLDQIGALESVLPEIPRLKGEIQPPPHVHDVWEHTLALLQNLEIVYSALVGDYNEDRASNLMMGLAMMHLGRFRHWLAQHFNNPLIPGRSLRSLLFLAALYHDVAKPSIRQAAPNGHIHFIGHEDAGAEIAVERAQALALSQVEVKRVETLVHEHMRIHHLAKTGLVPSRRVIFRYFRSTGPAGVELCLLSLADTIATHGQNLTQETWTAELVVCRTLLEGWWERREEVISPSRLLTGDTLMKEFKIPPGPLVGKLLGAIQEAQAGGEIHDRQQALDFARELLKGERNDLLTG